MSALSIGDLSAQTRTPVATIRYYESIGLLPLAQRTQGGQRQFGATDKARLQFINSRRALGFSVKAVQGLLRAAGPGTENCDAARIAATAQLATVRDRLNQLHQVEAELIDQINQCDVSCGNVVHTTCKLVL